MKPRKTIRTAERLLKYAGWYALRYMPSRAKLREALMKKSEDDAVLVDGIMIQMDGYIAEDRTIESLVRLWLDRGKTESYIRTKLRERQFDPAIVDRILDEYRTGLSDWYTYAKNVERRIISLLERGKSRKIIELTLAREYPRFRLEIQSLLDILSPDDTASLIREIEKLSHRHDPSDPKSRDKLIRKLMMRGFSYDAVRKGLDQKQ